MAHTAQSDPPKPLPQEPSRKLAQTHNNHGLAHLLDLKSPRFLTRLLHLQHIARRHTLDFPIHLAATLVSICKFGFAADTSCIIC